jgi:hypothetical protein
MIACALPEAGVPWAVTELATKVRLRAMAKYLIVTSWHFGTNGLAGTPL